MANLIEATRSLSRLRKLEKGWDYGRGGPISAHAYRNGKMLLQLLARLGATSFDTVPGDDDGAVIIAYHAGRSAEIHCRANGRYDLLHEDEDGTEQLREELSIAGLIFALEDHGWQSPRFFASCTRNAMSRESDDTVELPSGILVVGVCRLSARNALRGVTAGSANTYGSFTTPRPAGSLQSSGEYRLLPFQKALA